MVPEVRCVCGTEGLKVNRITAGNHLNPEYWHMLSDDMHFCPNSECSVVYFDDKTVFTLKEIKTKVFFKEKGSPKPLCYCKQVTEEDVIEAIRKGAKSVKEVEEITGIGNGGHCMITNPSGRCCRQFYVGFVEKMLEKVVSNKNNTEKQNEISEELPECCRIDQE